MTDEQKAAFKVLLNFFLRHEEGGRQHWMDRPTEVDINLVWTVEDTL